MSVINFKQQGLMNQGSPGGSLYSTLINDIHVTSTPADVLARGSARATLIWATGCNTNYTSNAELPLVLAAAQVRFHSMTFWGYEDQAKTRRLGGLFKRGMKTVEDLFAKWRQDMHVAREFLCQDALQSDPSSPIVLGGHSMGAADSLLSYEQFSPETRQRVSLLVFVAPGIRLKGLHRQNEEGRRRVEEVERNVRELSWQGGAYVSKQDRKVDPEIAGHVQIFDKRPWPSVLAMINYCEAGELCLRRLAGTKAQNQVRVLVIHGGPSDPTVDMDSTMALFRGAFVHVEEAYIEGAGHWPLVGIHRKFPMRLIAAFSTVHES